MEQGIGNFVIRLEFALGFFMPGLLERWLNGWYGQLGVGTRATIAEAVKSEASGAVSGSLRDQAEASFSLSKDPGGPDFFLLDLAEKLENSVPSEEQGDSLGARALAELRYKSAEQALNLRWPTNKDEAYRFTDVRFLKNLDIAPTPAQPASVPNFESGNQCGCSTLCFADLTTCEATNINCNLGRTWSRRNGGLPSRVC